MTDYWHTTLRPVKPKHDPVALVITGIVVVFIAAVFFIARHTG